YLSASRSEATHFRIAAHLVQRSRDRRVSLDRAVLFPRQLPHHCTSRAGFRSSTLTPHVLQSAAAALPYRISLDVGLLRPRAGRGRIAATPTANAELRCWTA